MQLAYATRPRPQRGELRAADAAVVHRAHGRTSGRSSSPSSTASAATRGRRRTRASRRLASALVRARHRQRRHRRGDARQHAGDDRGALRRADERRRAQHAQHAPRRRGDRLHARPRRGEGAAHRHRVRAGRSRPRSRSVEAQAARHRRRRSAGSGRRAARRDRLRGVHRAAAIPAFAWQPPADEWDAISLNYTSGTTGNPKGVVYHHRGAYLNALSNIIDWGMPRHAVYLWTLPMFHCNGWCFPWTMAANAGTNVCLRKVEAQGRSSTRSATHRVTHYCGAPIVHSHADQRARRDEAGHRPQGAAAWSPRRRRRRR